MLESYKGRSFEPSQEVDVYFHFHKKMWSVVQGGLVVGHTQKITVSRVTFTVNEKGRERVIVEQKKNVHAKVHGFVQCFDTVQGLENEIYYNPYKVSQFINLGSNEPIFSAEVCTMEGKRAYV